VIFTSILFLFCDFVVFVRRWFVRRLCATLFVFLLLSSIWSIQIVRSASIQCRFNQWL